jgi:hypothetical protein
MSISPLDAFSPSSHARMRLLEDHVSRGGAAMRVLVVEDELKMARAPALAWSKRAMRSTRHRPQRARRRPARRPGWRPPHDPGRPGAIGAGRLGSPHPGGHQPGRQRRQVHRRRRQGRGQGLARRRRGRADGDRQRPRDRRRGPSHGLRPLLPAGSGPEPGLRRQRARAGDLQGAGRGPRRPDLANSAPRTGSSFVLILPTEPPVAANQTTP